MPRENIEERETQWWFLKLRWIGSGCMYSGAVVAAYSFYNVVRYIRSPDGNIRPLWFGNTPMAFSAAASFVIVGLSLFWAGWALDWIGDRFFHDDPGYKHRELSLVEQIQIVLAVVTSVVMLASSFFSMLMRH